MTFDEFDKQVKKNEKPFPYLQYLIRSKGEYSTMD